MTATARDPLWLRSGISAADQALLSGVSFIVSILLIKKVSTTEFGYYSVAIPVMLLLVSVQNAIVTTPLIVLLVTKTWEQKPRYVASLWCGQLLLLVPAVLVGLAAVAILGARHLDVTQASVAAAVCLAALGLLFREFRRAYFFAEEAPRVVLGMDALYVALLLCFIGLAELAGGISAARIVLAMGVSSLLAGVAFGGRGLWRLDPAGARTSIGENWTLGKWALLGVLVTHVQSYSYLYLLGVLDGSEAVAQVSASRLLLSPLLLVQAGWNNVAVAHGSRLREEGQLARFFREQVSVTLLFAVGIAAYVALLIVFSGFLQTALLSKKYAQSFDYLILWGFIFGAKFVGLTASCGLQVLRDFRIITTVNLFTMGITVTGAYFLIGAYAATGGLVALGLGEALLAAGLWVWFSRRLFMDRGHRPDGESGSEGILGPGAAASAVTAANQRSREA